MRRPRTVKELKEFMKNIPDDVNVWGYEGESSCIVFSDNRENHAYFENEFPEDDDPWPGKKS